MMILLVKFELRIHGAGETLIAEECFEQWLLDWLHLFAVHLF